MTSSASVPQVVERPRDVVTTPARRCELEAAGHWTADTLPRLVARHAATNGGAAAVIDLEGSRTVSYAQLDRDVNRVAALLTEAGVGPGDVVSVQLPNWYETVAIDIAVLRVGAVLNPMLPIYRGKELRHMLTVGRVPVIFTPKEYRGFDHREMVDELRGDVPALRTHVAVPSPADGARPFDDLLAGRPPRPPDAATEPGAVSELIFTSGTEAAPKAVMHTEQTTCFGVRALRSTLGLTADDVVWTPSPIGHSTGLNYGVRVALALGVPVVLQDRWDPEVAVRLIERFRCSYTVAATTFVRDLCAAAAATGADVSSLRLFGSGGAPVPPEVVATAEELGTRVLRMYGSTEVLAATWNRPDSPPDRRRSTDGSAVDGMRVEVRDEQGRPVVGEPGEIFVRGGSTSVGFFGDPERTAATYSDGWVRSGDLGVLDADGYLSIVGRRKEIIIRGGLNIAPREVEDLVAGHPAIREVAIVGLPDERLGEIACACVVLRDPGQTVALGELVAFLRQRGVAAFKLPERLCVVDALPKTPTGKVQKPQLARALAAGELVAMT